MLVTHHTHTHTHGSTTHTHSHVHTHVHAHTQHIHTHTPQHTTGWSAEEILAELLLLRDPKLRRLESLVTLGNAIVDPRLKLEKDRWWHGRLYRSCVNGKRIVDWLTTFGRRTWQVPGCDLPQITSREDAVKVGECLILAGLLVHVTGDHRFKDAELFYAVTPASSVAMLAMRCGREGGGSADTRAERLRRVHEILDGREAAAAALRTAELNAARLASSRAKSSGGGGDYGDDVVDCVGGVGGTGGAGESGGTGGAGGGSGEGGAGRGGAWNAPVDEGRRTSRGGGSGAALNTVDFMSSSA